MKEITQFHQFFENSRLTSTCPVVFLFHTPVTHKSTDQRRLITYAAKKFLYDIKYCDKKLISVNTYRFFSSISFVRISDELVWLQTLSWMKNPMEHESLKDFKSYSDSKNAHPKSEEGKRTVKEIGLWTTKLRKFSRILSIELR